MTLRTAQFHDRLTAVLMSPTVRGGDRTPIEYIVAGVVGFGIALPRVLDISVGGKWPCEQQPSLDMAVNAFS
jgi:hypothetical protein